MLEIGQLIFQIKKNLNYYYNVNYNFDYMGKLGLELENISISNTIKNIESIADSVLIEKTDDIKYDSKTMSIIVHFGNESVDKVICYHNDIIENEFHKKILLDMSKYVLYNDDYDINSGHILVSKFRSDLLQVDPNRHHEEIIVFGDGKITRMGIGSSWFIFKDFPINIPISHINNYTNEYQYTYMN